jgi:muconolactone D-isomerase
MTNKALTGATYDSDGGQQINSPSRVTDAHPASRKEDIMEFLVEFEVNVPDGTPASEVQHRENAEATAAAKLVDEGHLLRVWKLRAAPGGSKVLGLYRANSQTQLGHLLRALPLYEWMHLTITPLEPHPNDPVAAATS